MTCMLTNTLLKRMPNNLIIIPLIFNIANLLTYIANIISKCAFTCSIIYI